MSFLRRTTRRGFLQSASVAAAALASRKLWSPALAAITAASAPLREFNYGDIAVAGELHAKQLKETSDILMGLSDDSLLKPFRQMAGQAAPGEDLGGWYHYDPAYDYHTEDAGLAPACTFGQWVSALARFHAITGSQPAREKVLRLNHLYAQTISGEFYEKNRFPAYCYDKLVLGLMESHLLAGDADAPAILEKTTDTALPYLPKTAVDREIEWRPGKDQSFRWDESYTNPENILLAYQRGFGSRYREIGIRFLDDKTYFDPLANGVNVLGSKHAYSYVNALSSAMQAYLVLGSEKHLLAAKNGFDMLLAQSYATGGWGPDELLRLPGSNDVFESLTKTHNSFETPCGSYAHFKLTRYLLRVTRNAAYGDSMERVMYNTVLGAKSIRSDGSAFYYSDCSFKGRKVYSVHKWPCCSGTLPQVATDYGINSYFRGDKAVHVNLYIPSTLRWQQGDAMISLSQKSAYPFSELIEFEITTTHPTNLQLNFRIPAWAQGASIHINGKTVAAPEPGTFAPIQRKWKSGDRIEIHLPMTMRLETIDSKHPDIVALMWGPLVLFATRQDEVHDQPHDQPQDQSQVQPQIQPSINRAQLLAAKRTSEQQWEIHADTGRVTMLPFVGIDDQPYTTYLQVT